MKYYFFRDIDNDSNFLNGKTYHAAGYVEKLYCELNKPSPSGKDLSVKFFEPFKGIFVNEWRSLNEVELFEVDEWEYEELIKNHNGIADDEVSDNTNKNEDYLGSATNMHRLND